MKLVWLSINCSYSHASLALPLIHAACVDCAGWEWAAVNGVTADDPAELAAQVDALNPDLLCATLYLFNRQAVLDVLQRMRVLRPDCLIAVGGPETLREGARDVMLKCDAIDFVSRGEGEAAIPPLLNLLAAAATDFSGVPGLLWRHDGAIVENDDATPVYEEWTQSPPPCRDPFFRADKPFVQVETARGCPNGCVFCTSARTPLRQKTPEAVHDELTELRALGIREIRMLDRTFNLPSHRAARLLRMFREEFPEMRFHLEIHPAFLTPEIRTELKQALPGRLHLEAGIQTLQADSLRALGRGDTLPQSLEGLRFLCSIPALAVHADLLTGCPCQTMHALFEDYAQLAAIGPAEIQIETLKVLPGTPLRSLAPKYGIAFSPEPPYDVMRSALMSVADMRRAARLSRMNDCFYNQPSLSPAFRMAAAIPGFLELFLERLTAMNRLEGAAPHLKQRFLDFAEACPDAHELLAIGWLREAFPVADGPAAQAAFVRSIPDDARLLEGRRDIPARGTKVAALPRADGTTLFFTYNRAVAPNKAAQIWTTRP